MKKINVLYVHSHDTGRYVQPYGHAIATPNVQRLAEEGVLFRQNFCIHPTSSPSRAALLTGCYPHENGMMGLAHRGWALYDYGKHLIRTLQNHGYLSVLAGIQHIAQSTENLQAWQIIGYDKCLEGEASEQAAAFLKNQPKEKPFFLSVGFYETHREFPKLDDAIDDPKYCLPVETMPDTPNTRQDMARFKASARILDEKIGRVMTALDESGLADDTLVICTTDHGIAFPRMKCNLNDSGIGTMLIMRGPDGFDGGKVIDAMTSHLDVFPTVCDLLDVEPPSWLRGASLAPLVRGEVEELHQSLFFQVNYHSAYEPIRAIRTKRWKYVKRFDKREKSVMPNCDDSESKTEWLNHDWKERTIMDESLFDLSFDPHEMNDLVRTSAYRDVVKEMRTKLNNWMTETNDPLLSGAVPAPKGAIVTDADALSPKELPQN